MTDIIPAAPLSIRRSGLPRLSFSKIDIGASLYAIARLWGHALDLAYVAPYNSRRPPPVIPDNDIEGRDPSW